MVWSRFVRSLVSALLVCAAFGIVSSLVERHSRPLTPSGQVVDYRVVACAERIALQRGDPYRTEPLRACEHRLGREGGEPDWSVTPFALPPYSAALLAPFGGLDFTTGRVLWYALLVGSLCLTSAALAEIVAKSGFCVALVLVPTLGALNLFYGESILIAVAGVALAALALQRGRLLLAAAAGVAALVEPAIGLPAVVGLFTLRAGTRAPLLAGVALLAVGGILALGFQANVEYLFEFIPLHEHSEIFARDQYSLTRLAYVLGAPERLASILGSLSYIAAIAIGVVAGRRLALNMGLPALAVLMPVAVSMLGGPFVHDDELLAAMLAAVVIAKDSMVARLAVALLSVAWSEHWHHNAVPVLAAAAGVAWMYLSPLPPLRRATYAVVVSAALLCANAALPKSPAYPDGVVGTPRPPIHDTDPASVPWEWRIRLSPAATDIDLANELQKLPYWLALALLPLALVKRTKPSEQYELSNTVSSASPV